MSKSSKKLRNSALFFASLFLFVLSQANSWPFSIMTPFLWGICTLASGLLILLELPRKERKLELVIWLSFSVFHASFLSITALTGETSLRIYTMYNLVFSITLLSILQFIAFLRAQVSVELQFLNLHMIFFSLFRLFHQIAGSSFVFPQQMERFLTWFPLFFAVMLGYYLLSSFLRTQLYIKFFNSFFIFIALPLSGFTLTMLTTMQSRTTIALKSSLLSLELNRLFAFFFIFLMTLVLTFIYLILDRFYKSHKRLIEYEKSSVSRQRLESLGRLAASLAHELNNSLSSIVGFADLLLEREMEQSMRKYLGLIKEESQNLEIKLSEILNFSRSQQPSVQVSLKKMVEETVEFALRNRRLSEFTLKIFPVCDLTVTANAAELKQVFLNLILNAADATDGKGALLITIEPYKESCRICFQDTGPGLSDEIRHKIFEPFITTKKDGHGLGLFISQQIMLRHGGEISYENTGKGACFVLTFPGRESRDD
ncbi:MAG: HAMP domain-containing sensor histidine kinase [Candidatus Wallbacteria bacterium]|nr:HAMP domain-containing sensor histidine kinase [Candidatus Wallbacteria bacterium]